MKRRRDTFTHEHPPKAGGVKLIWDWLIAQGYTIHWLRVDRLGRHQQAGGDFSYGFAVNEHSGVYGLTNPREAIKYQLSDAVRGDAGEWWCMED